MPGGQGGRRVALRNSEGTGRQIEHWNRPQAGELANVTAEILGGVGVVDRLAKRLAKRIVSAMSNSEQQTRAASQGIGSSAAWPWLNSASGREFGLLKVVASSKVPDCIEFRPGLGQVLAELLQRLVPWLVGEGAWPNPLDAKRGFAPAVGGAAIVVGLSVWRGRK